MDDAYERKAYEKGYRAVAGVDEAGRGPLAGPVVAAACVLPHHLSFPEIADSKKLTPKNRSHLFQLLQEHPEIDLGIGLVDHEIIDHINILQATFKAMLLAIDQLKKKPDYLLIDGNMLPTRSIPGEAVIKGDEKSISIAAASIAAKVTRDRLMEEFHEEYPEYGFDGHKGYGTKKHLEVLKAHGPSPIHRKTFAPVKLCIQESE